MSVLILLLLIVLGKCDELPQNDNSGIFLQELFGSNTTNNPTNGPSSDLTMLISMCAVAGMFIICGIVFGIYALCHRKREYQPII